MAARSSERQGRAQHPDRSDRGRGGVGNTGLPVQPLNAQGSGGSADLRPDRTSVAPLPPLRNDDAKRPADQDQRGAYSDADAGDSGGLRRGDVGLGADRQRRSADGLPATQKADDSEFRILAQRHRQEVSEAIADDSETWLRDGAGLLADKLDKAGDLALDWNIEILSRETPQPGDDGYGAVVRAKGVAAQTTLTTTMRVNEMQFRRQALGKLPELLKRIKEEEGKLKTIGG